MTVDEREGRPEGTSADRPAVSAPTGTPGRPVFLIGAARSGTSLLFKVMSAHPDAAWTSNWVQRYPSLTPLAALNRVAALLPDRRSRIWFGANGDSAYSYGVRRPHRDRMFPIPTEAETLYERHGVAGVDADEAALERLRRAVGSVVRWSGAPTFINKRIANNRRIPLLLQAFPDALFIEIVRDGRAVATSLATVDWWETSDVWWYGGTPAQWRAEGGDPWELCARNWVEEVAAIRTGLTAVPTEQVLSLRYEDLVADPIAVTSAAMNFAGLTPAAPRWAEALSHVRFPNKNERWRSKLDDQALRTIERVQREDLLRYGYLEAGSPGVEDEQGSSA